MESVEIDWSHKAELRRTAAVDEQETVILAVAAGELSRESLRDWLDGNIAPHSGS